MRKLRMPDNLIEAVMDRVCGRSRVEDTAPQPKRAKCPTAIARTMDRAVDRTVDRKRRPVLRARGVFA